jgi:predicted acylesterase/phospholipase RssA
LTDTSRETDKEAFLRATELFGHLDEEARRRLAASLVPVNLPAGAALMAEGDPADALYLLTVGRLRAYVSLPDGGQAVVGEIASGEMVGEMALLSDSPRSASVVAVRDCQLLRLSRSDFTSFVEVHPESLLAMTRLLVERLSRANRALGPAASVQTIAVLPIDGDVDVDGFAAGLVRALSRWSEAVLVDRNRVDGIHGPAAADAEPGSAEDAELGRWLHGFESQRNVVVYVADRRYTAWTARCVRQADRVLLLGRPEHLTLLDPMEMQLAASHAAERAQLDLVLVHRAGVANPTGTPQILEDRSVDHHHHIREGSEIDVERLARLLNGRAVGLVLSGGGARGIAHIGVVRALQEGGIPIDVLGGTSFGAVIAAFTAMGWGYERMLEVIKQMTVDPGSMVDLTFPVLALSRGQKVFDGPFGAFGTTHIEDLWTPYFCVSSDISAGRLMVHVSGEVWRAVRASYAIPGVFPPLRSVEGHVLVDGGVMDNLPVGVMRGVMTGGTVIAVDLRARTDIPSADLDDRGVVSGWRGLWRRLNPFTSPLQVPRMIDILLRATEVASGEVAIDADYTIRPPVEEFALLDFRPFRAIAEAGYRHTVDRLSADPVPTP